MNEFALIDTYFSTIPHNRRDVIFGIGDDCACLAIPKDKQLVVSCDTLVSGVHFLDTWDAYDIATRAVMVTVSDIAAMGALPCWLMLALTLPEVDTAWLTRFSKGLQEALAQFNIALIGGDTTRGPLSMTLTIHGLVDEGLAVRRNGAAVHDIVYVSGELGAAACALGLLERLDIDERDKKVLMKALYSPIPRVDFSVYLCDFASASIDISDGLIADLDHICTESGVGACLSLEAIPVHPLAKKYQPSLALDFALGGGDDYELCFTIPPCRQTAFLAQMAEAGLICYAIGVIESSPGVRMVTESGENVPYTARGYQHF